MTKGQLEAKLSEAVSKFEVDYMGRGPKTIKTYVVSDMIIVRLTGILSPAETKLVDTPQGIDLFKNIRVSLFEGGRGYLETLITSVINVDIISTHVDISTKTGEKIIIIITNNNIEELITK